MTYIVQSKRDVINPAVDQVVQAFRELESDDDKNNFEGNLNYAITAILVKAYGLKSYREINDVVGALECCKLEFYRRAAAPYEDQKSFDNGDVYNAPDAETLLKQYGLTTLSKALDKDIPPACGCKEGWSCPACI
jgi:hypothetical protein